MELFPRFHGIRRRRRHPPSPHEELVSDEEIDRMIATDVLASEKAELGKLDELESEIAKELGSTRRAEQIRPHKPSLHIRPNQRMIRSPIVRKPRPDASQSRRKIQSTLS